jgi:hypothetical protein
MEARQASGNEKVDRDSVCFDYAAEQVKIVLF